MTYNPVISLSNPPEPRRLTLRVCVTSFLPVTVCPYRMGSTTSGLMAVTRSSPTGMRLMRMISSWGTVCTWTSPGAGGGPTVRCRSREPCVMSHHLVSLAWVLAYYKTVATKAPCAVSQSSRVSNAQYCFSKCFPIESNAFTTYEVVCPSTWVRFGASCYSFEPVVQRLTLEEAREHCKHKANTSEVLTIQTEMENRFVLEQLWSYGFPHQTVWLGMFFNTDTDSMAWFDGSPMDYSNWNFKAPDPSLLTADTCVSTRVSDGMWLLSQCTDRLGFVCKTNSGGVTTFWLHLHMQPKSDLLPLICLLTNQIRSFANNWSFDQSNQIFLPVIEINIRIGLTV
uniref:C-type lectin domain-containing protein n=1 Tax=Hucho hucho TaxID=62062 RepID=A0A4W5N1G4_9TELE